MKPSRILLSFFCAIIALAVYLYFHLGAQKDVQIEVAERGPLYLLSKDHMGPYHQILPVIQEVERWALERGLPCGRTFGEYLDNPNAVDQDRLRSRGGCFLSAPLNVDHTGFNYEMRPARRYVVASFDGSPAIGPLKVYPKVEEYLQTQRLKADGAVLEVYQVTGTKVHTEFLFPVSSPSP